MNDIVALVDEFKASHIDAKKDTSASWKYLWYLADYCKTYDEVFPRWLKRVYSNKPTDEIDF